MLVDVGFSAKRTACLLKAAGESLDTIDAVFLTHEHSDHAQGIRGLAKRADLPVFANRDTVDAVQAKATKPVNWKVFQRAPILPFATSSTLFRPPSRCLRPRRLYFQLGRGRRSVHPCAQSCLGHRPRLVIEHVKEHIRHVHTLVIEANYDEELLERDERRPWSIKQRIRGRHGHLSNNVLLIW